jgi:hypothetical protein
MSTSRVRNAIAASGECTIFVHVRPANTTQTGPVRFVSYSPPDTTQRNFLVGQSGQEVKGRLRTTATDSNGMSPELITSSLLNTSEDTRAVLRFNGTHRLLSAKRGSSTSHVSAATGGNLTNWNGSWRILVGNEDTNDRAYLGRIYRVEIYDVALTDAERDILLNGGTLSGGGSGGAVTVK